MDQLVCPSCSRDYELPRRYFTRPDDVEFLIVPRLMNCLHTCCQSCLEGMWQKDDSKTVTCPQCHDSNTITGVRYLPVDVVALSNIIPLNGSSMSFCSRCHDEVPSFSWCNSCSATLCEFHHQDHKLSLNTAKHEVVTFKEISHSKIHIEPSLPPISCPEVLEQDSTLFCMDCKVLLSSQAMLTLHTNHKCSNISELVDSCRKNMIDKANERRIHENEIMMAMRKIRSVINQLNQDSKEAESSIKEVFSNVVLEVNMQESTLLKRLEDITLRKRQVLTTQLNAMTELLDVSRHATGVAEDILATTADIKGGGPYAVACDYPVERRFSEIEKLMSQLPLTPQADPVIVFSYIEEQIRTLNTILVSFGALETNDNIPPVTDPGGGERIAATQDDKGVREDMKSEEGGRRRYVKVAGADTRDEEKDSEEYQEDRASQDKGEGSISGKKSTSNDEDEKSYKRSDVVIDPQYKISFSVKTGLAPKLSSNHKYVHCKESVVVEARLLKSITPGVWESCESKSESKAGVQNSVEDLMGHVIGQVIFLTEIDKRIGNNCQVNSFYESLITENGKLPILRVTREVSLV